MVNRLLIPASPEVRAAAAVVVPVLEFRLIRVLLEPQIKATLAEMAVTKVDLGSEEAAEVALEVRAVTYPQAEIPAVAVEMAYLPQ